MDSFISLPNIVKAVTCETYFKTAIKKNNNLWSRNKRK